MPVDDAKKDCQLDVSGLDPETRVNQITIFAIVASCMFEVPS